ncbi:hypothetical protein FQZ97_1036600 [compost metagenome]
MLIQHKDASFYERTGKKAIRQVTGAGSESFAQQKQGVGFFIALKICSRLIGQKLMDIFYRIFIGIGNRIEPGKYTEAFEKDNV